MSEIGNDIIDAFQKSATEVVGVSLTEWRGQPRIDIRTYVPAVDNEGLVPTKKGVSLPIELYEQLRGAIRLLGEVMCNEREVARLRRSDNEEVRIGVTTFKGHTLIYIRTFVAANAMGEKWQPTQKGVSLRVELYSRLLDSIEALGDAIGELKNVTS